MVTAAAGIGRARRRAVRRLPPNLLSGPFGLLGLAVVWRTAATGLGTPPAVADALAVAGTAVLVAVLAGWWAGGARRVLADVHDPVLSPFVALAPIDLLLVAEQLRFHAPAAGDALCLFAVVVIVVLAGALLGVWMRSLPDPDLVHPGYLLPTVAGGLLAAGAASAAGAPGLAVMAFGIGAFGWLTVGTIAMARLLLRAPLPDALVPTCAILVAPPAVAGNAWFAMNGGVADDVGLLLAGITVLAAVAQLALVPRYRSAGFSPAYLSFTFSWTAVATLALRWIALERPFATDVLAALVLAAISLLVGAIAWRVLIAVHSGTFFAAPAKLRGAAP
ncbi:MAG TPA: hypothetical protein VF533_02545 [Solirubrobacteraceae bacterium]|jgi:tellurite resistance protein